MISSVASSGLFADSNVRPFRLLLVDDEPRNLKVLEGMLRPLGYVVEMADSGERALEVAGEFEPDMVLMDIMMPEMDGIEVCRRMKADAALTRVPVVFVSAFTDSKHHTEAVEAGAVGFLHKPVNRALLEASVRTACRLKQAGDAAMELLRQRNALSGMIVHDLGNLLSGVLMNAELIQLFPETPEPVRERANDLAQAADEMLTLTRSLLDVERFEMGALPMALEGVEVMRVWGERWRFEGLIRQMGLTVEMDGGEAPVMVRADAGLLGRIVDNLLTNAVKFSPVGGRVSVAVGKVAGAPGRVEMRVGNGGRVIEGKWHRRIFEKFGQVPSQHGERRPGAGLGLAFVRMACEAMGGSVRVESPRRAEGDGAEFVVELPEFGGVSKG